MSTITKRCRQFLTSEAGPTATEYAVMLALIILIAVGAISGLGFKVDSFFTTVDGGLPTGSAS